MEKVGIEINLIGAEKAEKTLKEIESSTRRLGAKRTMIQMEDGSLISVEERIKQIQDRLAVLKSQKRLKLLDANQQREMQRLNAELDILNRGLKNGTANARTFKQVFNSISSSVAHAGSAMQSMGNALTRIGSFMRPLTSGLLMGAGYNALNIITEGFGNSFQRADTMKNYERSLRELGLQADETFKLMSEDALTAKDNLDLAVQGLPTSLDEIMAAQKVYAGATGEMVSSTKTAIAANNAFLASSTDSRQQRILQRYFVALASGANLTANQWAAMQRNMPLVFRKIAEAMDYTDVKQFEADLTDGTASAQEFLKTFQELGTSGAIRDAAMVMTKSWSGLSSNIRIAATRMGQGVIETLNETFKTATGRDLLETLLGIDSEGKKMGDGIRDWINSISKSVQDWIKANPDRIIDFFNTLKSIDFKGLLKGMAEGLGWVVRMIEKLADLASGKDMSKVGRFLAKSGFIGRGMTIVGGIIKGMRHPAALFGTLGVKLLGKIGQGGLFGKIASFFGSKKSIQAAGDAAKTIPSVAETFKGAFSALQGVMVAAGAVTLVSGSGFVAFKSAKSILQDLKEMVKLVNGGGWDNVGYVASGVIGAIGVFTEIFNAIGTALGPQGLLAVAIASAATALVTGSFWADTEMIKRGLKNINDTIKEFDKIGETITSMKGLAGINTGKNSKLQASVDAIRGITDILVGKNGGPSSRGEYSKGLPSFSRITTDSIKNLANAVDDIKRLIETLNTLATVGINQNITTKMQQISRTLDSVIRVFSGGTDTAGNVHYAFPKFSEERANSVKNLADGIANMREIVNNLNALATIGINQNVLIKLQLIKKAVREVEKTFSTMFTKIQGPANLSANTNALAEGIRGLRRMVWHINNLAGMDVNNGGLSKVVGQIRTALEELQSLSGDLELDIEVKLAPQFQKSVDDTIKKIKKAKEDIKKTKSPSVSFSIPVNVTFSVSTNFASALQSILRRKQALINASGGSGSGNSDPNFIGPPRPAKGGLIYRAKGGAVGFPGRPIGTDRIPAWLSAGEYVHNKRAVDAFGIDFIRKVNNLDMKGAMNELMHRAGHMANINRGTNITNNNYNNQKVVINNSNAGAGYTFKTASRFVGAF